MRNFKQFLFENNINVVERDDIKIRNGNLLQNKFPNKPKFDCNRKRELTSLEGCPKETYDFNCTGTSITSLQYCPEFVDGSFLCSWTKITSLEYGPKIVNGLFNCSDTNITSLEYAPLQCVHFISQGTKILSLANIGRKYLKLIKDQPFQTFGIPDTIKSNALGLCLIKNLTDFSIYKQYAFISANHKLFKLHSIIKKHLQTDGDECREELIQNGYKDFAKF